MSDVTLILQRLETADPQAATELLPLVYDELLTLPGTGGFLPLADWSPDGDVIAAGPPSQVWHVPAWEVIHAAEAKEKAESKQP